jgi:chitinase
VAGLVIAGSHRAFAAASAGPGFPAHCAAPYLETWNSPSVMTDVRDAVGLQYFTLAFVISDGSCNATFNGATSITDGSWQSAINGLRTAGGDVVASFGGASGTELGRACGRVSALQAQYKRVVDALNLTRIDLDVEGAALNDTAADDRRIRALAGLQQSCAAAGRHLDVNCTLPVDPTGLESNSLSLLDNAKSRGLTVNAVNIMTMDYGPATDMGQAAIDAANALHTQLGRIWTGKTSDQLWAMEGDTPMIGVDDSTSEVFTTADASTLESFAASHGIQEPAFWAIGRDEACAASGTLSDSCRGTPQSAYQFARTFNALTGAPPPRCPDGPPSGSPATAVEANTRGRSGTPAAGRTDPSCTASGRAEFGRRRPCGVDGVDAHQAAPDHHPVARRVDRGAGREGDVAAGPCVAGSLRNGRDDSRVELRGLRQRGVDAVDVPVVAGLHDDGVAPVDGVQVVELRSVPVPVSCECEVPLMSQGMAAAYGYCSPGRSPPTRRRLWS